MRLIEYCDRLIRTITAHRRPTLKTMGQLIYHSDRNGVADLSLDAQNVLQITLVRFSPDQSMVADSEQLRSNRYPLTGNTNTAFENVVGMHVLANSIEVTRPISGAQANDAHFVRMQSPEPSDHFLGQSVTDKVVAGITTHVLERPDSQNQLGHSGPNLVANLGPEDDWRYRRAWTDQQS